MREIVLAVRFSDGSWLAGAYRMQRPSVDFLWRVVGSFATIYILVLAAALFIAYRLSRPFSQLARAAEQVGRTETPQILSTRGPEDVRRAVEAFNAMTTRVSRLLEEKDRFLGAIGHDLRTPIASLRIRAENLEPESERNRLIETLDETTRMLEDILELARAGRSSEEARLVDISALADTIVEEFRAMGQDVTFLDSPRAPVFCRKTLISRIMRNLIENAVKFGARARVRVEATARSTVLTIDDDGPGIPAEELEHVRAPFVRLESSRNRETGGAGLGLSIANTIAESQGARLDLQNRREGGLSARVLWPSH
jgi:signal transduction histidine kinase